MAAPLLVVVVLAASLLPGLAGLALPRAAAAVPPVVADVRLDELEPAVARPGDELRLTGTVTSSSDQVLTDVQALLRLSRDALRDRADVRQVAADASFRSGVRDISTYLELGDLAPGGSTAFTLRTGVDRLALPGAGVYVVGVDVRATRTDGSRGTVGIARTELAFTPGPPPRPVDVAAVLPLTTRPTLLPDGTLLSDDVAAEVAATGPLGGRLAAATDPSRAKAVPVTYLIDPDLLTTLTAMAAGYQVRAPAPGSSAASAEPEEGSGSTLAADFLADLGGAVGSGPEPRRLPTADVDVAAVADADDQRWAVATMRQALRAPSGFTDALGRSAPLAVAPAGPGLGPEGVALVERAGGARVGVVVGDAGLRAAMGPRDPGVATTLATRQRILAETYLAAEPGGGAPAAPMILLPTTVWSGGAAETTTVLDALRTAPWVRPVPLSSVASAAAAEAAAPPGRVLDPGHVAAVADLHDDVQGISELLADPSALVERFDAAELRALSAAWRGDPDGAAGYLRTAGGQLRTSTVGVQVLVPEAVTLSARSGRFPLTVVNDLAADVVVRVDLTAANRDRLTIEDPALLRLAAGEKATVTVEASAAANGRLPVEVQLQTVDGAPFGPSQTMIVVATQYGTVGWLVVAAGAGLLFATAGRRFVRRVRARRAAGPSAGSAALGAQPRDGAAGGDPGRARDAASQDVAGPGTSEVIR